MLYPALAQTIWPSCRVASWVIEDLEEQPEALWSLTSSAYCWRLRLFTGQSRSEGIVPEAALAALARENIPFTVKGARQRMKKNWRRFEVMLPLQVQSADGRFHRNFVAKRLLWKLSLVGRSEATTPSRSKDAG